MDERLIANVDRSGGPDACWPWTGCRSLGYGVLSINNRQRRAHRVIYEIAKGLIPKGLRICHKCDNPPCCNPDHLFVGTAKDNSLDMAQKERAGRNKLKGEQVAAIREDARTTKEIAKDYGVCWSNIAAIKAGVTWVHVGGSKRRRKRAKLTDAQVRAIRKDPRTGFEIAADYGITYQQVSRIKRRERWTHVLD
jgi:hypothetical protein